MQTKYFAWTTLIATGILCGGCAVNLTRDNLMNAAVEAKVGESDYKVAEKIPYGQPYRVVATFSWDDVRKHGGMQFFTWRYYKDDKLVAEFDTHYNFSFPPYTIWLKQDSTHLGVGMYRYELHYGGYSDEREPIMIQNISIVKE